LKSKQSNKPAWSALCFLSLILWIEATYSSIMLVESHQTIYEYHCIPKDRTLQSRKVLWT
jgi:hypothetical protein